MEINTSVSGVSTSFYSPATTRPVLNNYLDTLSDLQLENIIQDINHPALWSTAAMEMVPFIALNLPDWQNFSLRIEDENSREILFLPAASGAADNMVVLQQQQSPSYQLFFQPLIADHFEEITSPVYGDRLLIALCAARYHTMPCQISSMEVLRFRQALSALLADDEPCQDYINQYFRHWMPGAVVTDFLYQGNNDLFEQNLPQLGFTIQARGEDTHRQMPQLREALRLFDDCLWHMLVNIRLDSARLKSLLARQLNLEPAQVSEEMILETQAHLVKYQQMTARYTEEYGNQFILSSANDSRRGVLAEAFPEDRHKRIILTSSINNSPFIQILRAVPHEISHMMDGDNRAEDLFYVLHFGIADNTTTTETLLSDMLEENSLAYTPLGFRDLILSNIVDAIQSGSTRPPHLTLAQFSQVFERAKEAILDDRQWQDFLLEMQESYQTPEAWLNNLRSSVTDHHLWQCMAEIAGLEYHTPAQFLNELVADPRKLLKVVLRNADSLVLLVVEYQAEYIREYLRNHHRQLDPQQRLDSTEILSNISSTEEDYYDALTHPETLTPFQFFHALEDLALAAATSSLQLSAETPCNVLAGRFIRTAGRGISRALGALFNRGAAMPQLSHTLYLASLKRLLDYRLLTPQQVLNIISPDDYSSSAALSDAIADNFWRDGKLLAWQQLIRDCFSQLPPHLLASYRAGFTSSERGRGFFRQIESQLAVIENDPGRYPEVINTLAALVQDGLIPASYEVAISINRLRSANLAPGRPLINLDTLLKYTDENRVHIYNDYVLQLNETDMLAGIANSYGWYVVSENSEGDPGIFLDPQGNDISADPPRLTNNETVLVLGQNTLSLYQQTAQGPRLIVEQTNNVDNNLALLRAVEQLSGASGRVDDNTLIRGFLRQVKMRPAAADDLHALQPAPQGMSQLLDTEKINRNARVIHKTLHYYFSQMTAEDIPLLEPRKPTLLKKMKENIREIIEVGDESNNQQDINEVCKYIQMIENNLREMQLWHGVDSRLNYFHQLPRQLHLLRGHIVRLKEAISSGKQTKKNLDSTQKIKQLKKNTQAGLSRTLKTRGEIHSLISQSSDGTPPRSQLRRPTKPQSAQSGDDMGGTLSQMFASVLGTISGPAFSEQHFRQCEARDVEQQQQWLQNRKQRDGIQLQLREKARMHTELMVRQLANAGQPDRERKSLPYGRRGPGSNAKGAGNQTGSDQKHAKSENALPQGSTPVSDEASAALIPPAGQAAESPQPVKQRVIVTPDAAAQPEAAGYGITVNTQTSGTTTLLLASGTVAPPYANGRNIRPPADAQPRPLAANSGDANIMTFTQMMQRNNRHLQPQPERFSTLRLSTRRPPITPRYTPRREPTLRMRWLSGAPAATDPLRQDILDHRRMVVSAQRNQLFSATGERTSQRQQLDRYLQNRRTLPDPSQQQADTSRRFNRRMMQNESLLRGYYQRSEAQKRKTKDDG